MPEIRGAELVDVELLLQLRRVPAADDRSSVLSVNGPGTGFEGGSRVPTVLLIISIILLEAKAVLFLLAFMPWG